MTAKEYLNQARNLDARINSKLKELDYWRDLSTRISGCNFEEHHNPNRPTEAPFARCIGKIDELEKETDRLIDRYIDLRKEINAVIERMENHREMLVLHGRYIDGYTWEQIAEVLDVSLRTVHRIHGAALQNFPMPEDV